jgi:hypothetical protein
MNIIYRYQTMTDLKGIVPVYPPPWHYQYPQFHSGEFNLPYIAMRWAKVRISIDIPSIYRRTKVIEFKYDRSIGPIRVIPRLHIDRFLTVILKSGEEVIPAPCGHSFRKYEISDWLEAHHTCPECALICK